MTPYPFGEGSGSPHPTNRGPGNHAKLSRFSAYEIKYVVPHFFRGLTAGAVHICRGTFPTFVCQQGNRNQQSHNRSQSKCFHNFTANRSLNGHNEFFTKHADVRNEVPRLDLDFLHQHHLQVFFFILGELGESVFLFHWVPPFAHTVVQFSILSYTINVPKRNSAHGSLF